MRGRNLQGKKCIKEKIEIESTEKSTVSQKEIEKQNKYTPPSNKINQEQ